MANISAYQENTFNLNTEEYSENILNSRNMKRKHEVMEYNDNIITSQSILEKAPKDKQHEQPLAKRRQTTALFRPWEDKKESIGKNNQSNAKSILQVPKRISSDQVQTKNHPCGYPTDPCSDNEELRRQRNISDYLIYCRNKQAEQIMLQQQYFTYQHQQAQAYMRYLQQLAYHRQQQLFVFGRQN